MRLFKIMLVALVVSSLSFLALSCAAESAPKPEGQVVTVQRGDLRTDITGVGNLALSHKVDLAFEMNGTVEEVLVEEAKSVEEGQLLAKLDTSAWEDQVAELEDKVTAAERNVTAKERAVTQAGRQVTTKKRDLLQAQINLNNAQLALENTEQQSTDRLEIEIKELQLELTRGKLEDARVAVEDAIEGVGDAEKALADAKKALADARKALAEARDTSPEIKAPFAGFITKVNVQGGDEVKKGTVAVTIADPTKFEADIMVSEIDILKLTLGGVASVQVEAMPGMSLPAKVTHISPSATIQSGVVNYKVKVELASLQPVTTQQQPVTAATGNVTRGAPSGRSGQAFGSGNMTQEQIDQMMQRRQQVRTGQPGQIPAMLSGDFQLKEGLTVTVGITIAERKDVLLVPNQAIISRGRETLVQVQKDGVTEERPVQTGISNWQYTEITGGLSEGEQVIVAKATSTTPAASQQRQRGGFIPGMGRMLR